MSEKVPESFEVLSHLVKKMIKLCAQAPYSESAASDYMSTIKDLSENEDRLKSVLELIGKDIFSILRSISDSDEDYKTIVLEFDYEPAVYESMLADWLLAISHDEADEFYGLIELLPDEDYDTVSSFLFSLMNFYVNFIQSQT